MIIIYNSLYRKMKEKEMVYPYLLFEGNCREPWADACGSKGSIWGDLEHPLRKLDPPLFSVNL